MADDDAKARYRAALEKLARDLVERGLLIEAGWVACRRLVLPPDAPGPAVEMGRAMFFAGAQHLWGSIISGVLDPDHEPTEGDMRRMSLIDSELLSFIEDFAKRHGIELPFREEQPRGKPS